MSQCHAIHIIRDWLEVFLFFTGSKSDHLSIVDVIDMTSGKAQDLSTHIFNGDGTSQDEQITPRQAFPIL